MQNSPFRRLSRDPPERRTAAAALSAALVERARARYCGFLRDERSGVQGSHMLGRRIRNGYL